MPDIRQVVAIHEAYRLSAADRGAHLEDLDHSEGWDAVIADRVTDDDTFEARRALTRLAELPARQREDLSPRVAGFSYHEIAQIAGGRPTPGLSRADGSHRRVMKWSRALTTCRRMRAAR